MTNNLNELLYWIFDLITFRFASDFELKNRDESLDFRRILFKKQEELLGLIDYNWKIKKETEHNEVLKFYPFNDEKNN